MSINIALIPLALAMYVVMGEEKFNAWARSFEKLKITSYTNIEQIKKYIIAAGYDITEQWGLLKTHFKTNKKEDYFVWEVRDGKLCAVFSTYDDDILIDDFINDILKVSNINIFSENPNNNLKSEQVKEIPKITEQVFQTKFADEKLLIKTLEDIGFNCENKNGAISCCSDNYTLNFYKNSKENYEFKVSGSISNKDAYQKYKDVDRHYGEIVQRETIDSVKQKVKNSQTMKLENEEILEDNSVLLTIEVM